MKLFNIIISCLLVIIVAGCSGVCSTSSVGQTEDAAENWISDITLPVPVEFGNTYMSARGAINDVADIEEKSFRFFAVDKDSLSPVRYDDGLNIYDEPVKYISGGFQFERGPVYYPFESDVNFSFYAVLADDIINVLSEGHRTCVTVPVAESEDMLWGVALTQTPDDMDGFNAGYMRRNPALKPHLNFIHVLADLKLSAALSADSSLGQEEEIVVDSIIFASIPVIADLCVVDKKQPVKGGTFENGIIGDRMFSIGTSVDNLSMELFIVPQNVPVECRVKLVKQRNVEDESFVLQHEWVTLSLNPYDFLNPELGLDGYVAGYVYHYSLAVRYENGSFMVGFNNQVATTNK